MAGLQHRNGSYRVIFRYHGKQHAFTLGEVSQDEAEAKSAHVDYLLLRLKQRLATIPPGVDIVDYVQFDGKEEQLPQAESITLANLRDRYISTHEKSLELSTIKGIRQHFGHLVKQIGEKFPIAELSLADLQKYVDKRSKAKGRKGRKLSPATIFKELVTLRTAWNWGAKMKLVTGKFPNDGVRFPKSTEKPPFMTREEIERRIASSTLSDAETSDLWDGLYLTVPETVEFLEHVQKAATQPFVYPMICFAAHTGARRSEIIRTKIADVDFAGKVVTIHERKRVRGTLTTRRVPISPFLTGILEAWRKSHPGGEFLFCQTANVVRSKTRKGTSKPLTNDEAADHFTRTLEASKWSVVKGWHCLRHSFVSACASRGVDQRLVEAWAGHMSPEMSKRYAHLYPSTQAEAIARVFG